MAEGDAVVLVLSNSADATTSFLMRRAADTEHRARILRLDTDKLHEKQFSYGLLPTGAPHWEALGVPASRIGAVLYRRPRPPQLDDSESEAAHWVGGELRSAWGGILEHVEPWRWVDHPMRIARAGYKLLQLSAAREQGFDVPETLVTNDPSRAFEFCAAVDWQAIAKPISQGEVRTPEGTVRKLVYTNEVGAKEEGQFDDVRACPTLFQRRIVKSHDIRVTVIGSEVIAVALEPEDPNTSAVDCRRNNMEGVRYARIDLPPNVETSVISFVRSFDLKFSAIDLALGVDGRYWFLENNPVGQWAWLEEAIGVPISQALLDLLIAIADGRGE